jgi:hypothetical protein
MTPCVIAAAGLNRRVPGSRHLPNERLQIPDCTLAGSPTHRASYLKSPIWIVGSRFRSIRSCATVFGAWEEPSGKSRLGPTHRRPGEIGPGTMSRRAIEVMSRTRNADQSNNVAHASRRTVVSRAIAPQFRGWGVRPRISASGDAPRASKPPLRNGGPTRGLGRLRAQSAAALDRCDRKGLYRGQVSLGVRLVRRRRSGHVCGKDARSLWLWQPGARS